MPNAKRNIALDAWQRLIQELHVIFKRNPNEFHGSMLIYIIYVQSTRTNLDRNWSAFKDGRLHCLLNRFRSVYRLNY